MLVQAVLVAMSIYVMMAMELSKWMIASAITTTTSPEIYYDCSVAVPVGVLFARIREEASLWSLARAKHLSDILPQE